jgi:hypothetical protein
MCEREKRLARPRRTRLKQRRAGKVEKDCSSDLLFHTFLLFFENSEPRLKGKSLYYVYAKSRLPLGRIHAFPVPCGSKCVHQAQEDSVHVLARLRADQSVHRARDSRVSSGGSGSERRAGQRCLPRTHARAPLARRRSSQPVCASGQTPAGR